MWNHQVQFNFKMAWILANKNVRTVMTCLVLKKLSENVGTVIIIKNFRCRDLNPGLSGESRVS